MFYSHEILTQRKHGIATIWLVATLGSKSSSRRITKKAILDVNIQRACEVVITPSVPMALRLESNLLIGISRVYHSQCGYVLSDAEQTQHNMRSLLTAVRDNFLDPNAGKARPDQLFLTDEPGYLPDFIPELDMDWSKWDTPTPTNSQSTGRTPGPSPITSQGSNDGGFNIIIPSDVSLSPGQPPPVAGSRQERRSFGLDDDPDLLVDAGFGFDADGNMIDVEYEHAARQGKRVSDDGLENRAPGEVEVGGEVANQGAQPQQGQDNLPHDDGHFAQFDNDEMQLNSSPPQPPRPESNEQAQVQDNAENELEEEEGEEQAVAPVRPARKTRRPLMIDDRQDVRSSTLQSWQTDYLTNMKEAKKQKNAKRAPTLAKKFAAACVFGNGLGGLGKEGPMMQKHGPLSMFAGQSLKDLVFGKEEEPEPENRKRKRSDEPPSDDEERRVRIQSGDIEIGRGANVEEDMPPLFEDEPDIEFGRAAAEVLEDTSVVMPWNLPPSSQAGGSRAGSMRPPSRAGSAAVADGDRNLIIPFSAGGPPSSATTDLEALRRAGRQISSSPLRGRGYPNAGGLDWLPDDALEDFELQGTAAMVDTQTAEESQLVQAELRKEGGNFLEWIKKSMRETGQAEVTFQDVSPLSDRPIVASKAFLQVLGLVSRNLLVVRQEDKFAVPIHISLAVGA